RQPRPGQQARKDVAAQVVGAQRVGRRRAGEHVRGVLRERIMRGEQPAGKGQHRHHGEDRQGGDGGGTGQQGTEGGHAKVLSTGAAVRSFGVSAASSRSITKVLASTATTVTITAPSTTGMSPWVAPSKAISPSPGREKICSAMIAPPTRRGTWMPITDRAGPAACGRAWRSRIRAPEWPRSRAPSTKFSS